LLRPCESSLALATSGGWADAVSCEQRVQMPSGKEEIWLTVCAQYMRHAGVYDCKVAIDNP